MKINIDSENLKLKETYYKKSGKHIVVEFDKCFNVDGNNLNLFMITKNAYSKKADVICRYSNVFFNYYDKDKEFLTALLNIKYQIDSKTMGYYLQTFISDVIEYLLSDSIVNKINKMVDDFYSIDLTPTKEIKELYGPNALQFMNEHGKSIMALAVAYKLTIPVVSHYYAVKSEEMSQIYKHKGEKMLTNKNYLYKVFVKYFPLFENDSDIFNKLAITANSHITSTQSSDKIMWSRAEYKNITPTIHLNRLIASIIVDLIPKAIFGKNIIFLIQTALPEQIKNMLIQKDKYEYYEPSMVAKGEELSGIEKLEINSAKISDLDIILAKLNISSTIKKIKKLFNIKDWDSDEINFYKKNLKTACFNELILQFFSNYFGGFYDLTSISRKDYIKLVIVFKHIMHNVGFRYIQHIMTGNVSSKIKRRKISTKQLKKIKNSYHFKQIMRDYDMSISDDDENNPIIRNIALLINTPVELVDYKMKDKLGVDIQVNVDIVSDEYLRFIKML